MRKLGKTDTRHFQELHDRLKDTIPNTQDLIAAATFALNNKTAWLWLVRHKGLQKAVLNPEMNKALYASLDWDAALPIVDPFRPEDPPNTLQCITRRRTNELRVTRRLVLERLLELIKPFGGVDNLVGNLVEFHNHQWVYLEMVAARPQIQRFLEKHGLHGKQMAD